MKGLIVSVDVLTVSSKGQIVLPAPMRSKLSIAPGAKLAAYMSDGAILLKRINLPEKNEFEQWMSEMQEYAAEVDMKEEDIAQAIAEVRAEKHP